MFQIAGSYLDLQRVAFFISYAFPFTLAYRFGFVCLVRTYDLSQCSTNLHIRNDSNCGFLLLPSTCCVLDVMSVSLHFGLQIWICVSFLNLRLFANLILPLIIIYEMLQIVCCYCFHQRVVFSISLVCPFTLAYIFGCVCLF